MAHFKTAYSQREIVMDVKVMKDLKVGDLVELTILGNNPESITTATLEGGATHIVAQSDMTMNRRDFAKEPYTYEYSNKVAASTANKKKVALFAIIETEDVIVDGSETV
jgi:hypothetical protein